MGLAWEYFTQLHNARSSNGYSANPITYSEIESWNRLTDAQVTPLEVKIIRRLDNIYLNHQADKRKQDK